jgi:hypothetical protein
MALLFGAWKTPFGAGEAPLEKGLIVYLLKPDGVRGTGYPLQAIDVVRPRLGPVNYELELRSWRTRLAEGRPLLRCLIAPCGSLLIDTAQV